MKTNAIDLLLDEAKSKNAIKSDNALAIRMGLSRQGISNYRKGRSKPDDFAKSRLAELTGKPIEEVIVLIEIDNEPDEMRREYWKSVYRRLGGIAAGVTTIVTSITLATSHTGLWNAVNCILR